jgi:hypothetical protein
MHECSCTAHFIFLGLIILFILGEENKLRGSTIGSLLQLHIISSLFGPAVPSVYVLPLMSHAKFHTHTKSQAKITVLYIRTLLFAFLDSRREDKTFWTEW